MSQTVGWGIGPAGPEIWHCAWDTIEGNSCDVPAVPLVVGTESCGLTDAGEAHCWNVPAREEPT